MPPPPPEPETAPMPKLAIVVVAHDMPRELPRTLFSLSPAYQRGTGAGDYEVLVVDNGSREPLRPEALARFGPNFRLLRLDDASPSPAAALNAGVAATDASAVGLMIDGARLATPGVVREALLCLAGFQRPIVATLGFHLGPAEQSRSVAGGYSRELEDQLLALAGWREDGYHLYDVAALAGSSKHGLFGGIAESNLLFLPRPLFDELGGFDERFDLPGGGLVNLDFYTRACALPRSTLLLLAGEATFHQVHGGTITNQKPAEAERLWLRYAAQYERLRGEPYRVPERRPLIFGEVRPPVLPWIRKSCDLTGTRTADELRDP